MTQPYRSRYLALGVAVAALGVMGAAAAHEAPAPCQHHGAQWTAAKVVNTGATQCPSTEFRLTIGVGDSGGQLQVTFHGCPAFVDVIPGHGARVAKLHMNPVGPQTMNHTRQRYKADCGGWFRSPSCKPEDAPLDLPQTVDHWFEEACAIVTGGVEL